MLKIPPHLKANPEMLNSWINSTKEIHDLQKQYLQGKGWIVETEYEECQYSRYTHPEYKDLAAIICDSEITVTLSYQVTKPTGEIDTEMMEIPECLVGRISIDN